jgi:glycerophosphoryl diester phosphodiesterase
MAAFAAAVDLGYTYLETDVHGTKDGVAIVLHDAALDRTTDGKGNVAEMPYKEVKQFYIGGVEPIPTLVELLTTFPDVYVNLDIKADSGIEPTAAAIEKVGAHDRVLITSFSAPRRKATVRLLSKPVATAASTAEIAAFLAAARVGSRRLAALALREVDALQVPISHEVGPFGLGVVDLQTLDMAHAIGKYVQVWTVNTRSEMAALLDLGVDGIFTDRADTLRSVLESKGLWR